MGFSVTVHPLNRKKINFTEEEIKGEPDRFVVEGPIWNQFLDEVWAALPHADPSGVWTNNTQRG